MKIIVEIFSVLWYKFKSASGSSEQICHRGSMAEQRIRNAQVVSSILTGGSKVCNSAAFSI